MRRGTGDEPRELGEAQLARVRAALGHGWDEAGLTRGPDDVHRRVHRRRQRRLAAQGAALGAALAAAIAIFARPQVAPPAPPIAHRAAPGEATRPERVVRLADGSRVVLLDPATAVHPRTERPEETVLALGAGRARFHVQPRARRPFRVEAGAVTVEVRGTVFDVERQGERTHVTVSSGAVAVRWPGGETELRAGEAGLFPPPAGSRAEAPAAPPAVRAEAQPARGGGSWRKLARARQYARAYDALAREGARAVREEPGDLMLAADVARLSHHPAEAVAPLRRVLERHPRDANAPLAAFTLGRVLLEDLARPEEAAEAFRRARALDGGGPLAEHALAREVEASHEAGQRDRARALAGEYARRFPGGARLPLVRRFGGLDAP
jgi:transmembrane sensor